MYISELVFIAEWWGTTDLLIYIDKDDFDKYYGKEHGYLIMNHRYEVDWLVGWVLCERVRILGVSMTNNMHKLWVILKSALYIMNFFIEL